jgi:hypothetical protein
MRHSFPTNPLGVASNTGANESSLAPIEGRPEGTSRRSFLGRGLAVAAVPAALAGVPGLADAASVNGPFPSYYNGSTKSKFQEIQYDEYTHVNILKGLIIGLGGTPRPTPTFTGIQNLSANQFLIMSEAFENTGVHAYLGAVPYISNPAVTFQAAQIALVEAYHSGFVNTLANVSLLPGGIAAALPFTLEQVVNAVTPFISSLNDNGAFPASFSTTPSASNDLAILNFALLLELLEAEFYFYNVPALFPD